MAIRRVTWGWELGWLKAIRRTEKRRRNEKRVKIAKREDYDWYSKGRRIKSRWYFKKSLNVKRRIDNTG